MKFTPLAPASSVAPSTQHSWDVLCQVIDNFGDVGVCWRTATELVARGQTVRLWMDDASALQWMAPLPWPEGLSVHPWPAQTDDVPASVGDVVIEAFGCEIPASFVQAIARKAQQGQPPVWINLEYLSAEEYVEHCHRLPSRLMSGPAAGLTRWFFYPGFTAATGSLIREKNLVERQQRFVHERDAWRKAKAIEPTDCAISLFCYEPPALPQLLVQLQTHTVLHAQLLVTPGRAAAAMRAQSLPGTIKTVYLEPCPQPQFDEMLWASDLNLVRGEDSLVRAIWAGQPMVWHIYPQQDNAHHDKLNAFLDWLQAPDSLRRFHHAWNGMAPPGTLPLITPEILQQWQQCVQAARGRLTAQTELIEQLQAFVAEKS